MHYFILDTQTATAEDDANAERLARDGWQRVTPDAWSAQRADNDAQRIAELEEEDAKAAGAAVAKVEDVPAGTKITVTS